MKKFVRLACSICGRSADRLVDLQRVVPDRCTITLNCQGRLFPVQYTSEREITSNPVVGLVDWYPRGSVLQSSDAATSTAPALLVDTSCGSFKQMVLAVQLDTPPADGSTISLQLAARSASLKDYLLYTYRETINFNSISGVEDGSGLKTLRYDTTSLEPDLVEVFIDGVKLNQGPGIGEYQVYDGTPFSPVPPNTILFNEVVEVNGTAQVDVIVSKFVAAETTGVVFTRYEGDEARISKGSWENISYVDRLVQVGMSSVLKRYYLFAFDVLDNTALDPNTIYYPSGANLTVSWSPTTIPLDRVFLVFSREPHTQIDRQLSVVCDLINLDPTRDYLKYEVLSGVRSMKLTETSLTSIYPPLQIPVASRWVPETLLTASTKSETANLIDNEIVVGPDA